MIHTEITVQDEHGHLESLFSFEQKEMLNERVKYSVKREKNILKFSVKAKDSVALRSALNTITKIITVYEKAGSAIKNG